VVAGIKQKNLITLANLVPLGFISPKWLFPCRMERF